MTIARIELLTINGTAPYGGKMMVVLDLPALFTREAVNETVSPG